MDLIHNEIISEGKHHDLSESETVTALQILWKVPGSHTMLIKLCTQDDLFVLSWLKDRGASNRSHAKRVTKRRDQS